MGIHQVAVVQKATVSSLMPGSSDWSSGQVWDCESSVAPAKVEIAMAPMLIQYGGARSAGLIGKNV